LREEKRKRREGGSLREKGKRSEGERRGGRRKGGKKKKEELNWVFAAPSPNGYEIVEKLGCLISLWRPA
jgi:hypothetical protein